MTKYGKSPWVDRLPAARVPEYARQRGAMQTDVVVVGGGLTGCSTAYALAAAGVKVTLLEAGQIGRCSTGSSLGVIAEDPGVSFLETEKAIGKRAARQAFQLWRRSALDLSALLRRLGIKCDLQPQPTVDAAIAADQVARLRREQKARRDAGLEASLLGRTIGSELAIEAGAAMRQRGGAVLDPYRACVGLASAATGRGARIFERSPVTRITFGRAAVDVLTAAGAIHGRRVVVATGAPTKLFASLARHFWFRRAYLALTAPLPSQIRQQLGRRAAVVRDMAVPWHVVRWVDDERLMVSGANAPAGPERQRSKVIVQRTGQLMYELSTLYPAISGVPPAYGWDAPYARTSDGLPYIGPHRNFPRHLFAFGDASQSATGAYLASRILLRHALEEANPADELFAFTRHGR